MVLMMNSRKLLVVMIKEQKYLHCLEIVATDIKLRIS